MATDRHDNNGSAGDAGALMADGVERPARPIPRPVTGDRPVPEERRSRSELYSDLRDTGAGGDQGPRSSPDGPRMTDGAWEWKGLRLEAEANRIADEELSARRTAEGRESDGSYGDQGITPAMRRVEARLEHGTFTEEGRLDESLRRDLSWVRSAEIYQWERGEEMGPDLVEIGAHEAEALIERFREKWA